MLSAATRRAVRILRGTGADLPYGDPGAAHPGLALESYCWRIVDTERGRAVLVAATRCRDGAGEDWYSVVLAARGPRGGRTVVERSFDAGRLDPGRLGLEVGDGALRADADGLRLDLGPRARLDLAFDAPRRWPRAALGGLGLGHLVPRLSQYWHPHLLGAHVRGAGSIGGDAVELGGASAYGEKNWGRGRTPPAWWWGQAALPDGDAVLAFAGGVLEAGPVRPSATAIVIRAGEALAAFSPPTAVVGVDVAPGSWRLRARSATGWVARIDATADGAPLDLPVPVPGTRELRVLSHQHQAGHLAVELRRGRRLRLRAETRLAALERGGTEPWRSP